MISCDWCGREIYGDDQVGYEARVVPFDPLAIRSAKSTRLEGKQTIVSSLHFHEKPCREAWLGAAVALAADHEPTEAELNAVHGDCAATEDEETPEVIVDDEYQRHTDWRKLPSYEQDRRVLEALGDGWATNREITERLLEGDGPAPWACRSETATVTRRLLQAGEVESQAGQWGSSRLRYRRTAPSAELRQLAEQLSDSDSGGAS